MSVKRRDSKNRVLRNGESQKPDGRYVYKYYDILRKPHAWKKYNSIYKEELPLITPHVCCHTYCTIKAKSGMNPKTLQYLMGHSEVSVTMDTYTHLGHQDAWEELQRLQLQFSQKELGLRLVKSA